MAIQQNPLASGNSFDHEFEEQCDSSALPLAKAKHQVPTSLSDRRLLLYSSGNFGKSLLWGTVDVTLMFLLTDRLGIPSGLAGGLIFASLVLDACLYPLAGRVVDGMRSPIGRYGPMVLAGTALAIFGFVALFAFTGSNGSILLVALALATFRLGYVALDLSHNALLTLMSDGNRNNVSIGAQS